jgi:adenylate cyclase
LLEQALAHAGAHGLLAWCNQILFMRAGYNQEHRAMAIRHGGTALVYGRDDANALAFGAFVTGLVKHDRVAAAEAFERALTISPSSAFALFLGCIVFAYDNDSERAIDWAERALRVSPIDRFAYIPHHAIAISHFMRGRYEEAAASVSRAVQCNPRLSVTQSWLAAALPKLGRTDEAKLVARHVLELQPSFSSSQFCDAIGAPQLMTDALTKAWRETGLPP